VLSWFTLDNVSSAIQALGGLAAVVVAVIAGRAAHKFNESQAFKFQVDSIHNFNREIIELSKTRPDLAELVGKRILPDSDIVADYVNFMLLNNLMVTFALRKRGLYKRDEVFRFFDTAASLLREHGEEYVEALLGRGYSDDFCREVRGAIVRVGGYPQAERS
jgi:hypothetical protein